LNRTEYANAIRDLLGLDIDARPAELDAHGARGFRFVQYFRDVEQRLGGNAATIQTDTAGIFFHVDDGGLQTEVGAQKRRGVTARTPA